MLRFLMALLGLAVFSSACARLPASTRITSDELVCLQDCPPESLDPHAGGHIAQTQEVLGNVYESLVALDHEMRVVPALAESWSNPDERTWDFRLRRGVRFHSGGVVTAADVVWSFERARAGGHAALTSLASIEAVPGGVRLRTREPDASLLGKLRDVYVVSRSFVEERGEAALESASAGTGSFAVTGHAPGDSVELSAFAGCWRGAPRLRKARFVARTMGDAELERLVPAGTPLLFYLRPTNAAFREVSATYTKYVIPSLSIAYLGFDLHEDDTKGPFRDPKVRRAVARSLDLETIRQRAGAGFVPTQLVPPMVFGHAPELRPETPDAAGARALLAEAGFPNGFEVRLDYREMMGDLAVPLSEGLSRLGVSVTLNPLPDRAFFELLESGGSDLYLLRFSCRYGDSQELLDHWVHSRNEAAGLGTANYSYTACPVPGLDAEIDSARRELHMGARQERLQGIHRILARELLAIPVHQYQDTAFASPEVRWTPRFDTYRDLSAIHLVR